MKLWLVRHARAEDRKQSVVPDFQRVLTPQGCQQFGELCRHLVNQVLPPQLILTSPLIRAVQTAELLSQSFGLPESLCQVLDQMGPELNGKKLVSALKDQKSESVAIVGHEPSLSVTLSELLGGGEFKFAKGAIAEIEFKSIPAIGEGRLRWFLSPRLFTH